MPVIQTQDAFVDEATREEIMTQIITHTFPQFPSEAAYYELLNQGLLEEGGYALPIDAWHIVADELEQLQQQWAGPDVSIYILPMNRNGHKNGVAYKEVICLFLSPAVAEQELRALVLHEYHHICRRQSLTEPLTLKDVLVMEGLAEWCVEEKFGAYFLSPWTKAYTMEEIEQYWGVIFKPHLQLKGSNQHLPFLYGQPPYPPWIGYCTGYRIIEAYVKNTNKNISIIESTDEILVGAGFKV